MSLPVKQLHWTYHRKALSRPTLLGMRPLSAKRTPRSSPLPESPARWPCSRLHLTLLSGSMARRISNRTTGTMARLHAELLSEHAGSLAQLQGPFLRSSHIPGSLARGSAVAPNALIVHEVPPGRPLNPRSRPSSAKFPHGPPIHEWLIDPSTAGHGNCIVAAT